MLNHLLLLYIYKQKYILLKGVGVVAYFIRDLFVIDKNLYSYL